MSAYAGRDHKWDLLVIESIHDIWCVVREGGLRQQGEGGAHFKVAALCGMLEKRKIMNFKELAFHTRRCTSGLCARL